VCSQGSGTIESILCSDTEHVAAAKGSKGSGYCPEPLWSDPEGLIFKSPDPPMTKAFEVDLSVAKESLSILWTLAESETSFES